MVITSEEIFNLIDTAYEQFKVHNFTSSIETIKQVEELLQDDIGSNLNQKFRSDLLASLQNLRGFCLVGLSDFENASAFFSKGLDLSANNKQSFIGLAEIAYLHNDVEKVESLLNQLKNSRSLDNSISRNLTNVEQSIEKKLLDESKINNKTIHIQELLNQHQNVEAELQMKELAEEFPFNVDVLNNYASILILNEKYEDAINPIDTVLVIDPQNEIALANNNAIDKAIERKRLYPSDKFLDLFLHLSTKCNYKCAFCSQRNNNGKGELVSLDSIIGLEALSDYAKMVDITGFGEITLHPEFEKILDYLTKKNISIRFVTNGFNLTEKVCDIINRSSVTKLIISVNSLNRETYKYLMGVDGLEKVLSNIDRLAKSFKNELGFSFVISQHNFNEIKGFIDFGKKYNAHVSCLGLTPTYDYEEGMQLEITDEVRRKVDEYNQYAKEQNIRFSNFQLDNQKGTKTRIKNLPDVIKRCDWVYSKMFVGTDGSVKPCCWSSVNLGNVYEQQFEEIWEGEKYTELRNLIKEGNPKYCYNCRREG